jgi:hypothetical protein
MAVRLQSRSFPQHEPDRIAASIDAGEALNAIAFAKARAKLRPDANVRIEDAAGGCVIYAGPRSRLNCGIRLGVRGPLRRRELAEVERFFESCGEPSAIRVSSAGEQPFAAQLSRTAWVVEEAMSVMVCDFRLPEKRDAIGFAIEETDDREEWAQTVSRAYVSGSDEVDAEPGRLITLVPNCRLFLARSRDGASAGGAALVRYGELAILFGDGTLPAYRGLGVHGALIEHRLREAQRAACTFASALTVPGGASQRNYVRAGFVFSHNHFLFKRRQARISTFTRNERAGVPRPDAGPNVRI